MTHSGGQPHGNIGDRGQRYEITFVDGDDGETKVLGWANDLEGVSQMFSCINKHPAWHSPMMRDRQSEAR